MNRYRCSSCRRDVGRIVDAKGNPTSFLCPHSRQIAHAEEATIAVSIVLPTPALQMGDVIVGPWGIGEVGEDGASS